MPTVSDLGARVKIAHPGSYDDLPDSTLGRMVIAKYPGSYSDFDSSAVTPAGGGPGAQLRDNGPGVQAARMLRGAAPYALPAIGGMVGGIPGATLTGMAQQALLSMAPGMPGGPAGPILPSAQGMTNLAMNPTGVRRDIENAGAKMGSTQAVGTAATKIGAAVAPPLMRAALASPQLRRLAAASPQLVQDALRQGAGLGIGGGSDAADAVVAQQAAKMPPLLQEAHAQGYLRTPENFRPAFEQEMQRRFPNRLPTSPQTQEALTKMFNDWSDAAGFTRSSPGSPTPIPQQPLDAFAVNGTKQAMDAAAEKIYAADAAAKAGKFPGPGEQEMLKADFAKMMADVFRNDMRQIGGGKIGSTGAKIGAVNNVLSRLIPVRQAIQAAENAGVATSPGLHPFTIARSLTGPVYSGAAHVANNPALMGLPPWLTAAGLGGAMDTTQVGP